MRYRLRTLLIVLAVLPPLLSGGWFVASMAFKTRVAHPSYNDRAAAIALEHEFQAGRLPVVLPK